MSYVGSSIKRYILWGIVIAFFTSLVIVAYRYGIFRRANTVIVQSEKILDEDEKMFHKKENQNTADDFLKGIDELEEEQESGG